MEDIEVKTKKDKEKIASEVLTLTVLAVYCLVASFKFIFFGWGRILSGGKLT